MQVVRLRIGRTDMERLLERIANVFSGNDEAGHSWSANFANFDVKACAEAYRRILQPILQLVPTVDELTIVPDGILAGIPFECFVTEEAPGAVFSKGCFIVEKLALNYSSTATSLTYHGRVDRRASQALLAVGNPDMNGAVSELWNGDTLPPALLKSIHGLPSLPGAEREIHAIQNEFEGKATILLGRDASKTKVKSLITDYTIVHIAAHTSINQECPMRSAIYLAPDGESVLPGVLRASELSGSDINARLVVLSSCNTIKFSEGVDAAGFVRGLSDAGVPSVVGSLWSADDNSTELLMARFYHYLWVGEGIARALQRAKIDLISSGKADPFYWAPFILVGDPSPIDIPPMSPKQSESWPFAGILAAFVSLALLVYFVRPQPPQNLWEMFAGRKR
jgi:CHAT domain-containing protein